LQEKEHTMRASPLAARFLSRLRATGLQYEDPRVESVLAFSRVFLAATSLVAWLVRPASGASYYHLGLLLLVGYTVHSLVLLAFLQKTRPPGRKLLVWAQASDIVSASLLCLFTDPPNSVFFTFFLFAMIAAAFRWGFVETMATAEIGAALLLLQAAIVAYGPAKMHRLLFTSVEPTRIIMRCGFLLMAGFLLGFLAETEKELRAEIALTNRLLSLARVGARLATVLHEVMSEIGRIFGSRHVYEVVAQNSTGRVFRWDVVFSQPPHARVQELSSEQAPSALMRGCPHTFYLQRNRKGEKEGCRVTALDEEGRRLDSSELSHLEMPVPEAESLLVIGNEMGGDWSGRLVVVNARVGRRCERELRFAQDILRQVAPALYSVYVFRRFRSRAGAMERARVARELHDTAIQSLISIEMQTDVLRRRATGDPFLATQLARIQELLRQEVLNLRELMQTMRPIDIGPHQFLDFIAQLVERFSRDTGVEARFVSELQEVSMPPATCRELARVVQEGLVNIRRHSGARTAVVRFGARNGSWKLVIDDDGRGFPFTGRLNLTELDELRRGPTVIKERVRAVGGDLLIESNPGRGAKLEITVPQKGYESHG
jgi:signal transduction histidine kinase